MEGGWRQTHVPVFVWEGQHPMRVHPTILGESFIPDAAKGVLGPQEQVEVAGVSIVPPPPARTGSHLPIPVPAR